MNIINYGDYTIATSQGQQRGIFFRSPIQKVEFNTYSDETSRYDLYEFIDNIQTDKFFRVFQTLLGNGKIIKNYKSIIEDNMCSVEINILCCPIYFKRNFRKAIVESKGTSIYNAIQSIKVYGYESGFSQGSGDCVKEKYVIWLKNGSTLRGNTMGQYKYTYLHTLKDLVDGKGEL